MPSIAEMINAARMSLRAGQPGVAAAICREIVKSQPRQAEANGLLGAALMSTGDWAGAEAPLRIALGARPRDGAVLSNLGVVLEKLGKHDEAVALLKRAVEANPGDARTAFNLGNALVAARRLEEAAVAFERAIALQPVFPEAHFNLSSALAGQFRHEEALEHARAAGEQAGRSYDVRKSLGEMLVFTGRVREGVGVLKECAALPGLTSEQKREVLWKLASSLLYDESASEAEVAAAHVAAGRGIRVPAESARARGEFTNPRDPDRRLRIGYVSPDFREHSVAYFIEPVLAAHDRGAVECHCYHLAPRDDAMTERLRGLADRWTDARSLSGGQLLERIRADGIDVLVDLAGHSLGNRLEVFAARGAPVQCAWIGYPATTGIAAMDVRLVDDVTDPEDGGASDALYSERRMRVGRGNCFLCYSPAREDVEIGDAPCTRDGAVTFASFNLQCKINDAVLDAWAEILRRAQGSRLLVKNMLLADARAGERLRGRFAERGIDPGRIEIAPWARTREEHLAMYRRVDIALDTFAYNGTTTTCEALWMGVPVIVLAGGKGLPGEGAHRSRVGLSLLRAAGVEELASASVEGYVAAACELAADAGRIARYRKELRGRLLESRLCDAPRATRAYEAAIREAWRSWCAEGGG